MSKRDVSNLADGWYYYYIDRMAGTSGRLRGRFPTRCDAECDMDEEIAKRPHLKLIVKLVQVKNQKANEIEEWRVN